MEDSAHQLAFDLIMKAGNAKSYAMMAIDAAKAFSFEEAEQYIKDAEAEMVKAHHVQMDMIQQEAAGNAVEVNIILVHAQDHLSMAIMAKDMAETTIDLYKTIQTLQRKELSE